MAWFPYVQAVTPTAGNLMTHNNPPPTRVAPSNREWVHAVNPYSLGTHVNAVQSAAGAAGIPMAQFINSEIAFRGDSRAPATIDAAGGFFAYQANATGVGGQDVQRNPETHQAGPGNTIYISFARDISVAKGFAGTNYVYLARIDAGVDYNAFRGGNGLQSEVMAIHSVPLRNIIACRRLSDNQILINSNFQQATMTVAQFNAALIALQA